MGTGPGDINKTELKDWRKNLLVFLAPLGVIYLTAILGIMQAEDFKFSLDAFVPNQFTLGALALYLVNGALDFLRKYIGDNR